KARVSWDSVCRPKDQGGLGFKPLAKWNEVLLVAQVWKIVESKESLWVKWVNTVKLKGSSIWQVNESGSDTWHDKWCIMGPLDNIFSKRDIYEARFNDNAKVADLIYNGRWKWPLEWTNDYPDLLLIPIPSLNAQTNDKVLWVDANNKEVPFSTKVAWLSMRDNWPKVQWSHVVWFSQYNPRQAFILWLDIQEKLLTHDKILKWDKEADLKCSLCSECADSHEHLFFKCHYSAKIWEEMKDKGNFQNSQNSLVDIVNIIAAKKLNNNIWVILQKLLVASSVYHVWQERNRRNFQNESRNVDVIIKSIKEDVINKLTSLKVKDSAAVKKVARAWDLKLDNKSLVSSDARNGNVALGVDLSVNRSFPPSLVMPAIRAFMFHRKGVCCRKCSKGCGFVHGCLVVLPSHIGLRDHQLKGSGDAVEQGDEGEGPEACLVYFASVKHNDLSCTRTISGTKSGAETNTVRPQVHDGGSGAMAMDEGQGANKGVSVNEYLVKTLSPEDEEIIAIKLDTSSDNSSSDSDNNASDSSSASQISTSEEIDYDSPEYKGPPKSLLKWYGYLSDEYKDKGMFWGSKSGGNDSDAKPSFSDISKAKACMLAKAQASDASSKAKVQACGSKPKLQTSRSKAKLQRSPKTSLSKALYPQLWLVQKRRKGRGRLAGEADFTFLCILEPSVQGLLDHYGYNDIEEYLSWNYFLSTDKENTNKDIIDEDCIHESNYTVSKGKYVPVSQKHNPKVKSHVPVTCVLGLANVTTWDEIVNKMGVRKSEICADKAKGERKVSYGS
ncbi:RNA-directed DNA polymerase, eukaryota, reverse transcriptase zinc-binding domain protein, partial [Tanacetum coccineum]